MTSTPIRLLIVDDHALVREGLKTLFDSTETLQVIGEAASAAAALALVNSLQPHLVITDIGMREMNGLQLTAALYKDHPEIAILVLSMYDNPEYVRQALQAGARGYVLKDAPANEILNAIDAVIAGSVFISPMLMPQMLQTSHPSDILTAREREILQELAHGNSSKDIANKLNLSVRTVETHRLNLRRKLNIEGQAELIKYAVEHKDL